MSNCLAISWREQVTFNETMMVLALYYTNIWYTFGSIQTHYPDSAPNNLCSRSLILNTYKFHNLWFDSTGIRIHLIYHSRARRSSHHVSMRLYLWIRIWIIRTHTQYKMICTMYFYWQSVRVWISVHSQ